MGSRNARKAAFIHMYTLVFAQICGSSWDLFAVFGGTHLSFKSDKHLDFSQEESILLTSILAGTRRSTQISF